MDPLGPVQYEPIELIKLFIVLFLAAYLAETADVIASRAPLVAARESQISRTALHRLGRVDGDPRLQRDLGMATLLLATFAALLYVATRRIDIVARRSRDLRASPRFGRSITIRTCRRASPCGTIRSPIRSGAGISRRKAYYSRSPPAAFSAPDTGSAIRSFIPDVATDYVYAAFSEEFGLIGALVVLAIFLALVRRMFADRGSAQPDLYTKLLAVGLAATLGFQVFIIVGGVIGVFPLTGITLPFISYGGSSLVANFLLVALVWAMSARAAGNLGTGA